MTVPLVLAAMGSSMALHAAGDKLSLSDARHLLTRTGFGADPSQISSLLTLDHQQAVEKLISELESKPQSPPPAWINKVAPHHWRQPDLSGDERLKFRQTRRNEVQSLRHWWVSEMISTSSPQSERLTLFWHNHFATGYSGINDQSLAIARQHMMLREHSSGNFRTLLQNIIRDPAMLNYLDNNASRKVRPNENLGRELMELFSLGEGAYTESDVKNAARALTGYSYSEIYDQRFLFKHWDHDRSRKTIFGKSGKFDGDDLVDLILQKPEAARFIAAKFWRAFVGPIDTGSNTLTPHAIAFRQADYDIKTLYKSILLSKDFWHPDNRASIVQSPVSLTVGAIRSTGILPQNWQTCLLYTSPSPRD